MEPVKAGGMTSFIFIDTRDHESKRKGGKAENWGQPDGITEIRLLHSSVEICESRWS